MNNASAASTSFTVYVVCGDKPAGYVIVSTVGGNNWSQDQTMMTATCPSAAPVVLGGGGISSSSSTSVNMWDSVADQNRSWTATENNASATFYALAICIS
ncbi:MAG: hypothetical protein M3N98_08180 [Actinomycetota bacterium]|nr:hypothetical protein [Actinomycetota bacterium]